MVAAAIIKEPSVVVVLRCCRWIEKLVVRKKVKHLVVKKLASNIVVEKKQFLANHNRLQ